jgi:phosphatidylserine/phosphatidylglycerophosphate/cardiolipin synthase-like enzyme
MAKQWYITSGSAAREGNVIVPLVDGEETWLDILAVIKSAKETIHMTFWMMHLDHELDRPASLEFSDPAQRYKNTLHSLLLEKKRQGVTIRILLWVPATIPTTEIEVLKLIDLSILPTPVRIGLAAASIGLILDLRILKYAIEGKFAVLIEQHPTHRIGSWHQKTIVIDGRIAYVGGMNARQNDWDATHSAYDYRRMPHTTTGLERTKRQKNKAETEYPPRHDFMMRIEGALVMDVQNNFISRWNSAIDNKNFFYRRLTKLNAATSLPKSSGSKSGQIVRTMPLHASTPLGETGCFDMYVRAIRNAEKYIYIEDQYFRSNRIALELARACRQNPKLLLVVVTPPDYAAQWEERKLALASPSTIWTTDTFNVIKAAIPEFCLFYLQVSGTDAGGNHVLIKIDTHAKIMIVDDEWYTIGSCNINERGFIYEGEMNIGVHHPADAFSLRKRLWSEHLQVTCPDDIVNAARLWFDHAAANHKAATERRKPLSRVFGFTQHGPLLPATRKTWF